MSECRGCGTEATRTRSSFDARTGLVRTEICPACRPEEFSAPFFDPSDRKIYVEAEARPHLYQTLANGQVVARDEHLQDIADAIAVDPDAEALAKAVALKRATRRTEPMTRLEIEHAEKAWRPVVQMMKSDADAVDRAANDEMERIAAKYARGSA